jgi:hypothetical protein
MPKLVINLNDPQDVQKGIEMLSGLTGAVAATQPPAPQAPVAPVTPPVQPQAPVTPSAPVAPVAPAPQAPVTSPVQPQAPVAPTTPPVNCPIQDSNQFVQYIMQAYTEIGQEKGTGIQTILGEFGFASISDVTADKFADFYARVEALKAS